LAKPPSITRAATSCFTRRSDRFWFLKNIALALSQFVAVRDTSSAIPRRYREPVENPLPTQPPRVRGQSLPVALLTERRPRFILPPPRCSPRPSLRSPRAS
jgi:hypothetical protein